MIEETAYTWFNRMIAIRFMELNNYLSYKGACFILRNRKQYTGHCGPIRHSRAEAYIRRTGQDSDGKEGNRYDDAFRMLFVKQCNELNEILPGLFEKTDDYMELLLKITYTGDGVIRMLVDSIPENDFNVAKVHREDDQGIPSPDEAERAG